MKNKPRKAHQGSHTQQHSSHSKPERQAENEHARKEKDKETPSWDQPESGTRENE